MVTVGYSTRLGPMTEMEAELLDLEGVEVVELDLLTEEQLVDAASSIDFLIVGAVEPLNRTVLASMDRVRLIVRRGTGTDNVDIEAATDLGIGVANVPDASVEEVSDHALALLLNLIRRVSMAQRAVVEGQARDVRAMVEQAPRLSEMSIGVVGLGRIGARFAEKSVSLVDSVFGYDPEVEAPDYVRQVGLDHLLENSDAVSVHVPLTTQTRRMFDEKAFTRMRNGALFINTSRGEVVDEIALTEALKSGHLAGAGLDVLVQDPPPEDHPLLDVGNVIITGHTAGLGKYASHDLRYRSVQSVVSVIEGSYPESMLNPEVWNGPPEALMTDV